MAGLFTIIPGGFVPEEDQGYFLVNIQLPDAASLQRSDQVTAAIEQILDEMPGIDSVTSIAGYSLLTSAFSSNTSFIFVSLKPWAERGSSDVLIQ